MGPVHRFVATGGPAGALGEEGGVELPADVNLSGGRLFLEVALQAEVGIAALEQLRIDRAVGVVAGRAPFPHRLVLKHVRPPLFRVALGAGVVLRQERATPAPQGRTLVGVVAVDAADFSFHHRVVVGEAEGAAHVEVAVQAHLRGFSGIDDRNTAGVIVAAPDVGVDASRAVAGLATDLPIILSGDMQLGVGRGRKILGDFLVAVGTVRGPNEAGPRDLGGATISRVVAMQDTSTAAAGRRNGRSFFKRSRRPRSSELGEAPRDG